MLQQPIMFFRHQVTCFLTVVTCFLVHVRVHELLKQDMHAQSLPPFSYWKLHSPTHLYRVGFVSPTSSLLKLSEKLHSASNTHLMPLQSLCKSFKWQTTACWVLTSIRWSNHMWLTHQWSRINDCHLWLAFIFCGAIGGSWVVTLSLKSHPIIIVLTGDRPQTLLFITTCCTNMSAFDC